MLVFPRKGLVMMDDKREIQSYWESIGNDIWVALGRRKQKKQNLPRGWDAIIKGVKTLNPFGTQCKQR